LMRARERFITLYKQEVGDQCIAVNRG